VIAFWLAFPAVIIIIGPDNALVPGPDRIASYYVPFTAPFW